MATETQGPRVSLCEQHTVSLTALDGKVDALDEKVDALTESTHNIEQALKGYNGFKGLIPSFDAHCEDDHDFKADYYKFKRAVLVTAAFLAGSGLLGGGVAGIIKLVSAIN